MSDSISNGIQQKEIDVYSSSSLLEDNGVSHEWENSLWILLLDASAHKVVVPMKVMHKQLV